MRRNLLIRRWLTRLSATAFHLSRTVQIYLVSSVPCTELKMVIDGNALDLAGWMVLRTLDNFGSRLEKHS